VLLFPQVEKEKKEGKKEVKVKGGGARISNTVHPHSAGLLGEEKKKREEGKVGAKNTLKPFYIITLPGNPEQKERKKGGKKKKKE